MDRVRADKPPQWRAATTIRTSERSGPEYVNSSRAAAVRLAENDVAMLSD